LNVLAVRPTAFLRRVLCPMALMLFAAGCDRESNPTAPSSTVTGTHRIAVLGDSLAISPSRAEGFPAVLQSRLASRRLPWEVTNFGVRGDTTSGGRRRLEEVLEVKPDILIVALGANDGLRGVPIATLRQNLSDIIERAQARGSRVLLCGMEAPPIHGWNYMVAFHQVFPDLARTYDVPLVPFLLAVVALNPEMNGDDLIHPNAAGARQIAETIWPHLEPLVTTATAER
jgi:acyl-CoA thioesterase-1